MNTQTKSDNLPQDTLAEEAQALMAATADVLGDKVGEARKRLAAALDGSKMMYNRVKEKAVEGAKATDKAVRANPYQSIAIAVGVGALIGYLVARRCACKNE